jgi:hypothetical protein
MASERHDERIQYRGYLTQAFDGGQHGDRGRDHRIAVEHASAVQQPRLRESSDRSQTENSRLSFKFCGLARYAKLFGSAYHKRSAIDCFL